MKAQMEVTRLQQDFDKLADYAYDEYCNVQIAVDALEQIIDIPNTAASDTRAVREMVKLALSTLNIIGTREMPKIPPEH